MSRKYRHHIMIRLNVPVFFSSFATSQSELQSSLSFSLSFLLYFSPTGMYFPAEYFMLHVVKKITGGVNK